MSIIDRQHKDHSHDMSLLKNEIDLLKESMEKIEWRLFALEANIEVIMKAVSSSSIASSSE